MSWALCSRRRTLALPLRPGIRLQLLLSLGGLFVLAFGPLFFAFAQLSEATLLAERESAVRELGRSVAAHVAEGARLRQRSQLELMLSAQLGNSVLAVAVYDETGVPLARVGPDSSGLPARYTDTGESVRPLPMMRERRFLLGYPANADKPAVAVVLRANVGAPALMRLVAAYTTFVALLLLLVAYFALTRLVVRPVERLSRTAVRIAEGSRNFSIEPLRTRELDNLRTSLKSMTELLFSNEAALLKKVDELERATRELETAHRTLVRSERLASVGKLAAGMAHEIGNPVAAMLGLLELLASEDLPAEDRLDYVRRLQKEGDRVHLILRRLLDFSRPQAEASTRGATEQARGSAAHAARSVVELLKPQKQSQGVEVSLHIAEGLPDVCVVESDIEQVLLNLMLNALDEVPHPGGRVSVQLSHSEEWVVLSVEDNGAGVPESLRDRIFDPFVTTKETGKGTGLGLAVCRGIVESAGGSIAVRDAQGGGSCFEVRWPALVAVTHTAEHS